MTRFALAALVLLPALASADDARDRRARAALALSQSDTLAAHVAPAPRLAKPKCYATGHKEAREDAMPLVVYVGCDITPVEGAVCCKWDDCPGVTAPAVVVSYPVGDRMLRDAVLPCPAKPDEVKKAVKAAAGKCKDVRPMPNKPALPQPLDWKVSADRPGCVCGDDCKCAAGECPGACMKEIVTQVNSGDGLDELNAKRAARGLRPYIRDDGLTAAAHACASYRATYRLFGHVTGGMGDFAFLPAGVRADAAGCAAYPAEYGWLSCCMWENASHAGAAWVMGVDGKRYMHLYVRNSPPAVQVAPAVVVAAPAPVVPVKAEPVFVGYQWQKVCNGNGTCRLVQVPVYANP